ncbi:MAG TPA: class II fructose-bisphosphate aldolase [Firmicutes bacterium]|nr:class II fructose-bisphosphate aldolase [Bacillota bacterium]
MALVTLKTILKDSIEGKYAVGAFNTTNHSTAEAILAASEEANLPVIISIAETHFRYLNLPEFVRYLKNRIEGVKTPIALHLDHGMSLAAVQRALDLGFSSVMIDGSTLPLRENIELTSQVVQLAARYGASVEAELGHVGGGEGDLRGGTSADPQAYTVPKQAAKFVEETGIDALAIAIGTVHGPYRGEPDLDFELLKEIRSLISIPLVLHGGSGLSEADFRQAVFLGINKINFFTAYALAAAEEIKRVVNDKMPVGYQDLTFAAEKRIKEMVLRQMEIFGTKPLI